MEKSAQAVAPAPAPERGKGKGRIGFPPDKSKKQQELSWGGGSEGYSFKWVSVRVGKGKKVDKEDAKCEAEWGAASTKAPQKTGRQP